jgi:hypothetical protein
MSTSVALSWTASSFYYGIAAYQVWRSQGSAGNAQVIAIVGGGALTYTDTTVVAGTTYSYYVTATGNGFGNPQSAPSNTVTATPSAGTFDFYISPTGLDTDPGTQANPWSIMSINSSALTPGSTAQQRANAALMAGKKVGLLPGTYVLPQGHYDPVGGRSNTLVVTAGGSSGSPTTFQSTTPRAAILTHWNGSSYVQSDNGGHPAVVLNFSADWCSLVDVALDKCTGGVQTWGNNHVYSGCSFTNISATFANIYLNVVGGDNFAAIGGGGVNQSPPAVLQYSGLTVSNCYFFNITSAAAGYIGNFNCNCVDLFAHGNITVQNCEAKNVFSLFYPKGQCGVFTIQNNYVHDCNAMFRTFNVAWPELCSPTVPGARCTVRNNIGWNLVCASLDSGNAGQVDTDIYNNTFGVTAVGNGNQSINIYTNNDDLSYGNWSVANGFHGTPATTCTWYNNILYPINTPTAGYSQWRFRPSGNGDSPPPGRPHDQIFTLINFNAYTNKASNFFNALDDYNTGTSWSGIAAWRAGTGYDGNSIQVDPLLVNEATPAVVGDFKLQGGSPCVLSGRVGGLLAGAACDIGAWGQGGNPGKNW